MTQTLIELLTCIMERDYGGAYVKANEFERIPEKNRDKVAGLLWELCINRGRTSKVMEYAKKRGWDYETEEG